ARCGRRAGTLDHPVATQMGTDSGWIRNHRGETRKGACIDDTNGTVVMRSQGVAVAGRTSVTLEVTRVPAALMGANPPSVGGAEPGSCYSGKNACDDGSSTHYGMMINLN